MTLKAITSSRLVRTTAIALAALALAACLSACGGGSDLASVPRCKPHAEGCRETSNSGDWIPVVYWYILLNQQNLTSTQTPSYQSSVPSSVAPSSSGVSPDELEEPSESAPDSEGESNPSSGEENSSSSSSSEGEESSGAEDEASSSSSDGE